MEPEIEILLEAKQKRLQPGETLRGGWRLNAANAMAVKSADLSVLWFTEGKGDSDEGVIFHQVSIENSELDAGRAFPFEVRMPPAPWTYDGRIVKIRWAARVYITPQSGKTFCAEERFQVRPKTDPAGLMEERGTPPEQVFGASS